MGRAVGLAGEEMTFFLGIAFAVIGSCCFDIVVTRYLK